MAEQQEDAVFINGMFIREKDINGKQMFSVSFNWSEFVDNMEDLVENDKVVLDVWERRSPSASGVTHYAKLNTYKSKSKKAEKIPEYGNSEEREYFDRQARERQAVLSGKTTTSPVVPSGPPGTKDQTEYPPYRNNDVPEDDDVPF